LDYDLLVQTMRFLLLDKRDRPFLLLEESKFGGPVTCSDGTIWLHSIDVRFQNISNEKATHVSGHAAAFLDEQLVKPSSLFNEFTLDPYTAARWSLLLSEQTYASGISPSHKFQVYINIEYYGTLSDRKYQAHMWSTYDPIAGTFRETFTDLQESVIGGSQSLETKWTHPSRG
jgi:hypothetical protein